MEFDLPVMDLWVKDFFSDEEVLELDPDDQGAYLLLLSREWQMRGRGLTWGSKWGTKCARMCGYGRRRWRTLIRTVICRFFVLVDGRLYNPRLESYLQKAAARKRQKVEAGRLGGRASGASSGGVSGEQAAGQALPPSSSLIEESLSPREANPTGDGPGSDETATVWHRLTSHPWSFGHAKAAPLIERGLSIADLDAWEQYAGQHGRAAACAKMREFAHPAHIPADPAAGAGVRDHKQERRVRRVSDMMQEVAVRHGLDTGAGDARPAGVDGALVGPGDDENGKGRLRPGVPAIPVGRGDRSDP